MQLLATGTRLAGSEAACGSSAAHQHAPEGSPVPFPQGTPRLWVYWPEVLGKSSQLQAESKLCTAYRPREGKDSSNKQQY